jgi:hypothetical protein
MGARETVWKERFIAAWKFGPAGGEDAPHQALMMEGKGARCRCGHWPYDFDHIATVMGERLAAAEREAACCHLHNTTKCCDPDDCGPCCAVCPTCPSLR